VIRAPSGYEPTMTAPGQEPDEVLTAKPEKDPDRTDSPNLDKIGDNHMPHDVREAQREETADSDGDSASDAE
jgi:hypothetical protein